MLMMQAQNFSDALPARWNDGVSAAGHSVLVRTAAQPERLMLFFPDGRECSAWRREQIELTSRKDELPLRLARRIAEEGGNDAGREGERLTVEHAEAARRLLAWMAPENTRKKKRAARRWGLAVLAVWLFFGLLYASSPFLFGLAAKCIPRTWEENLGKSARESIVATLSMFAATRGACDLGAGKADLEALKNRLIQDADTAGYSFDILVLDSQMVNAFALPGGYMALTTALIQACASADELAGVLAHEMAHVTERHGTSRMLREQSWQLVGRLLIGSEAGAAWMRDLAMLALRSAFDRDQEREADMLGAGRLMTANIHPAALADFFGRLQEKQEPAKYAGVLSYIASHPDLAERETYLREAAATHTRNYTPALSHEAWRRLKHAAYGSKAGNPH
jgi:hypothetical protein